MCRAEQRGVLDRQALWRTLGTPGLLVTAGRFPGTRQRKLMTTTALPAGETEAQSRQVGSIQVLEVTVP